MGRSCPHPFAPGIYYRCAGLDPQPHSVMGPNHFGHYAARSALVYRACTRSLFSVARLGALDFAAKIPALASRTCRIKTHAPPGPEFTRRGHLGPSRVRGFAVRRKLDRVAKTFHGL